MQHNINLSVPRQGDRNELLAKVAKRVERAQLLVINNIIIIIIIIIIITSSCARSARFATCARSSLRFNYFVLWSSASLLLHSTCTNL